MNKVLIFSSIALFAVGCKNGNQQASGAMMGAGGPKELPVITVGEQRTTSDLSFPVNIEGVVNSPVQAKISGYITKVLVDEGQAVSQGQPMFQLETQTLNQSAASAKAQVEVAQAEVNKLSSNIGFAVVKAPVSGVVGAISYREGALVTANNTVLTTVSDVKDVYAYFSMNEKDYLSFLAQTKGATTKEKLANFAEVSLVLANGQLYNHKGKIQTVTGQIDPTTGSIQIRATFPNPDRLLTNGNSGTILIPQTFDKSLVIPEVAVFEQQGKIFVYKVEDNTIKQTVVTLKNRANNLAVVETGLKAGDVIIVQGLNGIRTGDKVKPQPVSMDSIVKAIQPIF